MVSTTSVAAAAAATPAINNNKEEILQPLLSSNKKEAQTNHLNRNKKKHRLSRKEQKARKRQKKNSLITSEDDSPKKKSRTETDDAKPTALSVTTTKSTSTMTGTSLAKPNHPTTVTTGAMTTYPELFHSNDNFDATYIPTAIPKHIHHGGSRPMIETVKSLGKWFPKAVVVKSKAVPLPTGTDRRQAALVLFYQYVSPAWPTGKVDHLMNYLSTIATHRTLGGRIRIAREGVNATISSLDDYPDDIDDNDNDDDNGGDDDDDDEPPDNLQRAKQKRTTALETLHHFAKDLQQFDPDAFANTHFKYITHLDASRHFVDLKILPVQELVFYGLDDTQAPLPMGGQHLSPQEFHTMLSGNVPSNEEVVVVDVRNHYEAAIGRFDGQEQIVVTDSNTDGNDDKKDDHTITVDEKDSSTPARYIDPKMRKSTDFPTWLNRPETQEQLANKHVLLYCTGGVRCERASAHVNWKLGNKVKGVYQLQGGIEHYLQTFPDGGFWRGKNFVFDKREAVDVQNVNGDGGVVQKSKQSSTTTTSTVETHCCVCDRPWDRYVGKKKCDTCGVPVLMCDGCMSKYQKKKRPVDTTVSNESNVVGKRLQKQPTKDNILIQCPLCKEQGVTVKVDEVEYTKNGVAIKEEDILEKGKAAPSVLKWGGGHAAHKKEKRKFQNKPCRFGAECVRKDCFFAHPTSRSIGVRGSRDQK